MQTRKLTQDQKLMLRVLNKLPTKTVNTTKDENLEDFYKCLQIAFLNYFTGVDYLKGINFDETQEYRLKGTKKYFNWKFREYLHLYNILNFGWTEIKTAFKNIGLPLDTPGELWAFIVGEEADYRSSNSIEKTPPQKLYRKWLTYRKLREKLPVSAEEIVLFEKFIEETKMKYGNKHPSYVIYREMFLGICRDSKEELLLNELKQYEIVRYELIALTAKNLQHQDS